MAMGSAQGGHHGSGGQVSGLTPALPVTPQHIEVLVVAVDEDLFATERSRGSLAGGVTQTAIGQPAQRAVPNAVPIQ